MVYLLIAAMTDSVQGARGDIDPESDDHDDYLGEFKSMVVNKMRNSIDRSLINDPDCIKGRKKTVQVCVFVLGGGALWGGEDGKFGVWGNKTIMVYFSYRFRVELNKQVLLKYSCSPNNRHMFHFGGSKGLGVLSRVDLPS